jgi:hypothetical protein
MPLIDILTVMTNLQYKKPNNYDIIRIKEITLLREEKHE